MAVPLSYFESCKVVNLKLAAQKHNKLRSSRNYHVLGGLFFVIRQRYASWDSCQHYINVETNHSWPVSKSSYSAASC